MEIAANLCPISQPLDIIQELISNLYYAKLCILTILDKSVDNCNLTELVQGHFKKVILTEESEALIPKLGEDEPSNYSLLKITNASIVQDCIEDEFFQPFMKTNSGKVVNSGLWTRSLYGKDLNEISSFEPDYSKLQVRKRMLVICKETSKPFIVALYREAAGEEEWEKWRQETFKMNSLHSLIGVYEAADKMVDDEEGNCLLPTIHLLKRSEHAIEGLVKIESSENEAIRRKLVDYLTTCLKGNKNAAESLMLSLVSRPSMRVDGLVESLFIGKLSLNLCVRGEENCENAAEELTKLLKVLKPFVAGPVKVEASLEGAFTKESIYPRLNVQSGQLTAGAALQQPDGCVLVVDETKLSEGEFKDQAVCNLQALIDLIRQQHVNYDFGMQQVALKTDMPIITVSLKKKSVLPFDLAADCGGILRTEISLEDVKLFKSFLHHCRELKCSVSEEMASFLEQDYIALRKSSPLLANGNPKMNEQEFHRLMNLARLRAASHGHEELSKETWEQTKALYN